MKHPDTLPTASLTLPTDLLLREVELQLAAGNTVTLRACGASMRPFIREGRDSVVLRQPGAAIRVGDIVLAHLSQGYVLHRVYAVTPSGFCLMGDGNLCQQEHCRREEVVGVVVRILRNGRSVCCGAFPERLRACLWRKLLPVRRYLLKLDQYIERWKRR